MKQNNSLDMATMMGLIGAIMGPDFGQALDIGVLSQFQKDILNKISEKCGFPIYHDRNLALAIFGPKALGVEGGFMQVGIKPIMSGELLVLNTNANDVKFWRVLAHELSHASGTAERLNRETITQGTNDKFNYILEELIAETSSMRILDVLGLSTDKTRAVSQDYIRNYKNKLPDVLDMTQVKALHDVEQKALEASNYVLTNWLDFMQANSEVIETIKQGYKQAA